MKSVYIKILVALILIAIGIAGRLLPHLWNFTPVIAVSIIAGLYLGYRYAFAIVLAIMLLSDIFLGFYSLPIMVSVYGSIALFGIIGMWLKKYKSVATIGAGSIVASVLFFLITNSAVWAFTPYYASSIDGLFASLTAGLPFFRTAIVGDLVYSLSLFVIFEFALSWNKNYISSKKLAPLAQ